VACLLYHNLLAANCDDVLGTGLLLALGPTVANFKKSKATAQCSSLIVS